MNSESDRSIHPSIMKKIRYSKDVDTLLIELSDDMIAYAEDEGQVILHYSNNEKLVLDDIFPESAAFITLL